LSKYFDFQELPADIGFGKLLINTPLDIYIYSQNFWNICPYFMLHKNIAINSRAYRIHSQHLVFEGELNSTPLKTA